MYTMRKPRRPLVLSEEQRTELKKTHATSKDPRFARRCHGILLKAEGLSDQKVADLVGVTNYGARNWIRAFIKNGIDGIRPVAGRGRKPIYTQEEHDTIFRKYVGENRQRLEDAKLQVEKETGKTSSDRTFKRVLKKMAADGSAFD